MTAVLVRDVMGISYDHNATSEFNRFRAPDTLTQPSPFTSSRTRRVSPSQSSMNYKIRAVATATCTTTGKGLFYVWWNSSEIEVRLLRFFTHILVRETSDWLHIVSPKLKHDA
jgi:hypothetical protein